MRILGLDAGEKRIGVAISDPSNKIALSLEVVICKERGIDLDRIKDIVVKNEVGKVIVGLPINMKGQATKKTEEVMIFVEELKKVLDVPVETYDERFTTMQSEKFLIGADVKRKKRRDVIDKIAAQFILQGYLDSIRIKDSDADSDG